MIEIVKNDPAVKSINLQRLVTKSWREVKNSYKVASKLSDSEKAKVNRLLYNRLKF